MTHKSKNHINRSSQPVSNGGGGQPLLFSKRTLTILLFTCLVGFALIGTASADTIFHINGGTWDSGATPYSPGVSGVSGDTFVVDATANPAAFRWPDFADLNYENSASHLQAPTGAKFLGWRKMGGTDPLRFVSSSGVYVVDHILYTESGGLHAINDLVDPTANEEYYAIWGYSFYADPNNGRSPNPPMTSHFIAHFQYGDDRPAEDYTTTNYIPSNYLTHPDAPWTFEGWYAARTGVNSSMGSGLKWNNSNYPMPATSNIIVYGNWVGNITFDANGGTFSSSPGATTHKMPITPATKISDVYVYMAGGGGGPSLQAPAGGWTSDSNWYTAATNGVIDDNDKLISSSALLTTALDPEDTLYAKYSKSIFAHANGPQFGHSTTPSNTVSISVQYNQLVSDIEAIIATYGYTVPTTVSGTWDWASGGWYTARNNPNNTVNSANKMDPLDSFGTALGSSGDVYMGWTGNITLDANGGTFGGVQTDFDVEVQPGQTYADLKDLIAIELALFGAPENGSWTPDMWYTILSSGTIVDTTSFVDLSATTSVENLFDSGTNSGTLYVGWFGNIELDANGGTFGPAATGAPTIDIEVQAGQTYADLDALIAAELTSAVPENDAWTAKMWYTILSSGTIVDTTSFVDLTDLSTATTPVETLFDSLTNSGTLYVGWIDNITLDANGGSFGSLGSTVDIEVQVTQTYADLDALITAALVSDAPVNGAWTPSLWYTTLSSGAIVDTTSFLDLADPATLSALLTGSETLYVGWIDVITLDANGGSFGTLGSTIDIEVQATQTYADLEALIATELASDAPVNGPWTAKMWYTLLSSGTIVDTTSFLDLTDAPTLSALLIGSETLYVGWIDDITLNANGGSFGTLGSTVDIEVQATQTYADLEALIATALASDAPVNGSWTAKMWYTTLLAPSTVPGLVDTTSFLDLADPATLSALLTGSETLYVGWIDVITLDANGGSFGSLGSTVDIEVQATQTYADLEALIAIELASDAPVNGAWTAKMWYQALSGTIVDTTSFLDLTDAPTLSTLLSGSEILYVGWFDIITLDANGGAFGSSGPSFIDIEVQDTQTHADLDTLIAAALTSAAPENGLWTPDMWYTTLFSGTIVDTASFLDLSALPATSLAGLLDPVTGGGLLYVGWFGSAFFDPTPGAFDSTVPVDSAGVYEMTDIQPGEDVSGFVPLAARSGYTLIGWINSSSLPWNFYFDDADEVLTADWKQNPSGGSGFGSAKIVDGYVSTPVPDAPPYVPSEPVIDNSAKNETPNVSDNDSTPDKGSNRTLYIVLASALVLVVVVAGVYYFRVMKK